MAWLGKGKNNNNNNNIMKERLFIIINNNYLFKISSSFSFSLKSENIVKLYKKLFIIINNFSFIIL